jgi:HD-GYP domain-containing protein (c-di-GMP phosphodiesterase class II)
MAQSPKEAVKPVIVVADGSAHRRLRIANALSPFYDVRRYGELSQALSGIRAAHPAAAVIGDDLPDSDGFDLVRILRLDAAAATLPVLMVVGTSGPATARRVRQCGAQCHLPESCADAVLVATVSQLINRGVEESWTRLPQPQREALESTADLFGAVSSHMQDGGNVPYASIAEACRPLVACVAANAYEAVMSGVRAHDDYTYAHSLRVATLLSVFGSHLGLTQSEQVILASGGLLHDVGKIAIPHKVLNKAGPLTETEWTLMRGHVAASEAFLRRVPDLPKGILTIAAQHHEKLDGSGYPRGLKGSELDFLARTAATVDVFVALTDRRVYKPSMSAEAALKIMRTDMAAKLDMTLVRLFRELVLDSPGTVSPAVSAAA